MALPQSAVSELLEAFRTGQGVDLTSAEVRWVLSVEDWAEIRRLHFAERMPIKVIARAMGCSKNTVKAAVRSTAAPKYERAPNASLVDEAEPRIRELLQAWPTMPATVIAERIDWEHSIRALSGRDGGRQSAQPWTSSSPQFSPSG